MLFLISEEQNKCKGKHYPHVCFITKQTAETISNMQTLVKKSDNFPLLPSFQYCFFSPLTLRQMTFGYVDIVLCIFFHLYATGQDKVQMPRDSGKM